jgi:cytochrome c1
VVLYVLTSELPVAFVLTWFQDYVFSLLTGYMDPPAGVEIRDGMNYNPYFPGGAISMARVLFDGLVEYEDGMSCAFVE